MADLLKAGGESGERRHDLDALRAGAMLLGVLLHAALAFTPVPWPVQDSRQSGAFGLLLAAIHGFRMPLFFLLSGFFTAMLWRRRGLKPLVWHRVRRVLIPCLLGLVTVVPAVNWISARASASVGAEDGAALEPASDIWTAAARGDVAAVERFIGEGADVNGLDRLFGATPLSTAVLCGHTSAIRVLLENGADVNVANRDGGTAMHAAAFLGRVEAARLLMEKRPDLQARNSQGLTPAQSAKVDWGITVLVAAFLKLRLDEQEVKAGRLEVLALIGGEAGGEGSDWVAFLTTKMVFNHLWFLWYLCWLVAGFAVVVRLGGALKWGRLPGWLVLSPARYLWLIPLTMVPQWFMGRMMPSFGPDTSVAILPVPSVLFYYLIFFAVGAIYYECDDREGRVGKRWWMTLPVAVLLVLPLGLFFTFAFLGKEGPMDPRLVRLISAAAQVAYAWLMTFGMMGLFRKLLARERGWVRYLSDSAYWLYLAHLPLVIAAQLLIRDWSTPALFKLVLICVVVTGLLLVVYDLAIRYTWVGTMLNGKRVRGGGAS